MLGYMMYMSTSEDIRLYEVFQVVEGRCVFDEDS